MTSTAPNYSEPLSEYGDLMTVEDFRDAVQCGAFIDDDGYGHPVKLSMMDDDMVISPSKMDRIPSDADHIMWFNR